MEFKIDTKDSFIIVTPVIDEINAKMADDIAEKCSEIRQSGSCNIILDLNQCQKLDTGALMTFMTMHQESYSSEQSLVFTGTSAHVMNVIKSEEADLVLNIAPTMKEAVDIISMEILERELFNEE
jgi:anti-anti-sigma factor